MHRSFYLARILRNSGHGGNESEGSGRGTTVVWIILGIVAAALLAYLGICSAKFPVLLGNPVDFIKSLFFLGAVMGIILALPGFINNLYMADDLQVLLTLPYKPTEITAAKIINSTGMVFGFVFVTTIPFEVAYGIVNHMGTGYFIAVLCAVICIPVITISFISIIIMLIMFFVNGLKNKDTLKIIGGIFVFVLVIGYVLLINSGNASQEQISEVFKVIGSVSNILPVNFALEVLITEANFIYVLWILLITAGFLAVFLFCAAKLYIPGAISIQETHSNARALDERQFAKACTQKSVYGAYFVQELRHVKREPAYLMSGWLYTIFYPAVMLIIYVFTMSGFSFMKLTSITDTGSAVGWCTGITLLITFVASSTNAISASCMSREGEAIMILKQTPVDYRAVLKAKMDVAAFSCSLGSTTYVLVGGIILAVMGYIPAWAIAYSLVLNIGCIYFIVGTSMMHDLKKPSFTWETEAGMVKKCTGASSIIMLILGIIIPAIIMAVLRGFPGYYLIFMAVMIVVCLLLGFLKRRKVLKAGTQRMMKY